jgi:hypothetical protein
MPVLSLFQAVRISYRLYKLDLTHVESYAGFIERFHEGNSKNSHWSERQIRESYDLWRRDILKKEVRAEFENAYFRDLLVHYLKDWSPRINIVTMILLTVAVLFPPYYLAAGDQSVSVGFGFAFTNQIGRIDSLYLICEIIGIVALSWFANRLVQIERQPEKP